MDTKESAVKWTEPTPFTTEEIMDIVSTSPFAHARAALWLSQLADQDDRYYEAGYRDGFEAGYGSGWAYGKEGINEPG